MMLAHGIEKGLTLENSRSWFGEAKIRDLIRHSTLYQEETSDRWVIMVIAAVLKAYLDAHEGLEPENTNIRRWIDNFLIGIDFSDFEVLGGSKLVSPLHAQSSEGKVVDAFIRSRTSVRRFTGASVDSSLIEQAVELAQCAPSVCNRQSSRVHVVDGETLRDQVLACQSGNAGFGNTADKVLVVSADLRCFLSTGERNQAWIDGGIFAMTLLLALHGRGVGACSLNWSAEHDQDRRLRSVLPLDESEVVIMMLAVGQMPKEVVVAYSQRRPLEKVLRWHK